MRALAALVVVTLVLTAFPVTADEPPKDAAFAATAYNTQRKIARGFDGAYHIAYVARGETGPRIAVARTPDLGATWQQLPSPVGAREASDRPSLAIDSRGILHLAWTEQVGEYRQILYAAFEEGAWGARTQLSSTEGYSGYPSVVVDALDRVHVVWYGFDGEAYQVHYRLLEKGAWQPVERLTGGQLDALNPALAVAPDGSLHVAYYRTDPEGLHLGVYYLTNRPSWGTPDLLSDPTEEARDPTLTVDANGTVHIAWAAGRGPSQVIVYRNLSGGKISPPAFLSDPTAPASNPSIAVDAMGRVTVLWEQRGNIIRTTGPWSWSSPERLTNSGHASYPTVRWAAFGDGPPPSGTVEFAWTEEGDGAGRLAFQVLGSASYASSAPTSTPSIILGLVFVAAALVGLEGILVLDRRLHRRP